MGHYAKVLNGTVTQVIVADENFFETFVDTTPGEWIKTSYNTHQGVHYEPDSNPRVPSKDQSKALRKNFAGVGYTYDRERDAFIPPKPPFASWVFDEFACDWLPPIPEPREEGRYFAWDEENVKWYEIFPPN